MLFSKLTGGGNTHLKFRDFIKLINHKQSFTNKGCPYDNVVIESFHFSLKKELIYRVNLLFFEHAKLLLFDYIDFFIKDTDCIPILATLLRKKWEILKKIRLMPLDLPKILKLSTKICPYI